MSIIGDRKQRMDTIRDKLENGYLDVSRTETMGHLRFLLAGESQAEALRAALQALVDDWKERARLARPLDETAPISAERRARIAEWMFYTNRANELAAALARTEDPPHAHAYNWHTGQCRCGAATTPCCAQCAKGLPCP